MRTTRSPAKGLLLLAAASCLGLGVSGLAVPAQAQIPEAHYVGDHDGYRETDSPETRIELDVTGTGIATRVYVDVYDLPYGQDVTDWSTSVRDHSFVMEVEVPSFGVFADWTCKYGYSVRLTGTFDDGQGVAGEIRNELIGCPYPYVAAEQDLTWSATTDTLPPPDTTAPETTITKRPKDRVVATAPRAKVKYAFKSSESGSRFKCRLDERAWEKCASPKTYKVRPGKHVFKVRAIDAAGNADPTPAKDRFRVVR